VAVAAPPLLFDGLPLNLGVGQTNWHRMEAWRPFDSGSSVGAVGSEGGCIVRDDEHPGGARITIERGGQIAPFSITCGVYGWMVHTRFFTTEAEAQDECAAMKTALADLVIALNGSDGDMDAASAMCARFVERFP
jgi:hypothetical protein